MSTAQAGRTSLVDEIDALLCGLWPEQLRSLFDPEDPKPLAIGIGKEIADRLALAPYERRQLSKLLGKWTGRISYLKALRSPGAMRHGLNGAPVEPVAREHVVVAREQIHQARAKRGRRQAELDRQAAKAQAVATLRRANAALPTLRLGGAP